PIVTSDDALDGGQAYARSFEFFRRVEPLKDPEELRGEGHVEAGAVVTNVENGLPILLRRSELDACFRLVTREFPRVAEQVLECSGEEPTVAIGAQAIGNEKLNITLGLRSLQPFRRCAAKVAQVDRRTPDVAAGDAGEREQALDEL